MVLHGKIYLARARNLICRLLERTDWPAELIACKSLPEVRALRAALHDDAEPALDLLLHPKPQVRIAALASLEFRPNWLPGQAEVVLRAAKFATEPLVRATAIMALANADNPNILMSVTSFSRFFARSTTCSCGSPALGCGSALVGLARRYTQGHGRYSL